MYNTDSRQFEPVSAALAAKFADSTAQLTPTEQRQKQYVRLEIGEVVTVKGLQFRVGQIGPRKLVLRPITHLTKD